MSRTVAWILVVGVAAGALAVAAFDSGEPRTNAERAYAIANDYACPACDGQSVAESDVPIAREIRREINARVDAGATEDDIRAYLVSRFGTEIDLRPPADGVVGFVWFLPVAVVVSGLAGMAVAFRHWSRQSGQQRASDADTELVARYRETADADRDEP